MWKSIWNVFSTISIIALTIVFVKWYVKGHFGKYFIFFWLNTLLSFALFFNRKSNLPQHDPTPGYVYWERNRVNE